MKQILNLTVQNCRVKMKKRRCKSDNFKGCMRRPPLLIQPRFFEFSHPILPYWCYFRAVNSVNFSNNEHRYFDPLYSQ